MLDELGMAFHRVKACAMCSLCDAFWCVETFIVRIVAETRQRQIADVNFGSHAIPLKKTGQSSPANSTRDEWTEETQFMPAMRPKPLQLAPCGLQLHWRHWRARNRRDSRPMPSAPQQPRCLTVPPPHGLGQAHRLGHYPLSCPRPVADWLKVRRRNRRFP